MESFIGWIGGKKVLRKAIIERFPNKFDRYIEVFGGAGWVLFGSDRHAKLEVFNDIDSNLINLYRCIKYHCEEIQRELEWCLHSREMFYNYKQQMNFTGLTDIQRAARYFIIIKNSFGADRYSFATAKSNYAKKIEYMSEIKKRLENVVIENKNFSDLIKVYDRPGALFYLDPPYYGTEKYYNCSFGINEHKTLCDILKNINATFCVII